MSEALKGDDGPNNTPTGSELNPSIVGQGSGTQRESGFESKLTKLTIDTSDMSLGELDKQQRFHYGRFMRFGGIGDIEKAIEYATRALDSTAEGDPELANRYSSLGISYDDRFRHLGELSDLGRAIKHGSHAVALTPHGHPNLPPLLGNLGNSYNNRFRRLSDLDDLEKAIEHRSRALELTPDGHPRLSHRHASLGASYTDRFKRMGDMHDLERAIEQHSCALKLTPDEHPDLPHRHADLGGAYSDRFGRLGELHDLEIAIDHKSRAIELTPDGHPRLSGHHDTLGISYANRYQRLGEIHDLEIAIERFSHALELTSDGHPDLSCRHASLGASYGERFQRLGEMHDLEKSIEQHSRALQLTPDGHPDLPRRHADLGLSYTDRYRRLGKIHDLEKSIEQHSRALELTPNNHPHLSDRHASLGVSYSDRFQRLRARPDLEKAVEHDSRALELTSDGHPALLDRYFNRACTSVLQYQCTNDRAYLNGSLDLYRRACQLSPGSPRKSFQNALRWAKRAATHSSLNCIEAYQATVNLLPQFIWLGSTTTQRYQDLSTTENLAIDAANAAILHANPNLALEWLEHARCVVWSQTLMLRTPLDHLQSSHPDLALRLRTVSKELHKVGSQLSSPQPLAPSSANFEQIGRTRRHLALEYNNLLAEVRTLPGFEGFLLPLKVNRLVHAARYGPIVVINCHQDRCDALVILAGEDGIKHLPLLNFSAKEAQNARFDLEASLRSKGLRERGVKVRQLPGQRDRTEGVLLTLWTYIVKPILDFLGLTNNASDKLPNITWCPTGALSFLPLHAAGNYDQPQSRVFDYVISSYIPTLTSLFLSASSSPSPTPRLLAISQANTPGHAPLPGTTRELAYVKAHAQNNVNYSQLIDNQATITTVLEEMEKHDWVHLACHAHQSVEDPTMSGFYLHNGTLDLASINQQSFKNKGLAFLSACQTATGNEKLPDEAIHLASGMLMAGYTSVIATMWSVNDGDAPLVADKVYGQLMKDRQLGNGEAGRALHNAVAELRNSVGEKAFSRWVPYIHIGS